MSKKEHTPPKYEKQFCAKCKKEIKPEENAHDRWSRKPTALQAVRQLL